MVLVCGYLFVFCCVVVLFLFVFVVLFGYFVGYLGLGLLVGVVLVVFMFEYIIWCFLCGCFGLVGLFGCVCCFEFDWLFGLLLNVLFCF